MFIKEAHILIEQGLQKIGVFAHSDIDPDEIDLSLKTWIWKVMDRDFPSNIKEGVTKPKLDKYALLLEKEIEFTPTLNARGDYEITLPDNYFHIVKLDSVTLSVCGHKHIESGKLEEGEWYYNAGDKTVTYNSISIPIRKTFKATSNLTYNTPYGTKAVIYKLKRIIAYTRFEEEEFITIAKNNGLSKSIPRSTIASVVGKKIVVSVDNFFLEKVYISYLKKPIDPNIKYKTISSATALEIGKSYDVVEGDIIYNGTTYKYDGKQSELSSFVVIAGTLNFTGIGKVRIKGQGDIELPYQTCLDIIDKVIIDLSITSEDNQSKIQGKVAINQIK